MPPGEVGNCIGPDGDAGPLGQPAATAEALSRPLASQRLRMMDDDNLVYPHPQA